MQLLDVCISLLIWIVLFTMFLQPVGILAFAHELFVSPSLLFLLTRALPVLYDDNRKWFILDNLSFWSLLRLWTGRSVHRGLILVAKGAPRAALTYTGGRSLGSLLRVWRH